MIETKLDTKDTSLTAVIAALYATLVIVQGLSAASTIQLRIADCLIPLSAILGWPAVLGVTFGSLVGNTYTSAAMPNGVYDLVVGPVANLAAGTLIYVFRRRRLVGCVLGSIIIGLFVGSYVWMIFGPPSNLFGLNFPLGWPVWAASIASITASSLVAIAFFGYVLLTILSRSSIVEPLKSKGLKAISADDGKGKSEPRSD